MRLISVAVGLAVLITACLPAPSSTTPTQTAAGAPKDVMQLRVGTATSPAPALPESTLWLARDLGFYQKEGLDVEIVETTATPSGLAPLD